MYSQPQDGRRPAQGMHMPNQPPGNMPSQMQIQMNQPQQVVQSAMTVTGNMHSNVMQQRQQPNFQGQPMTHPQTDMAGQVMQVGNELRPTNAAQQINIKTELMTGVHPTHSGMIHRMPAPTSQTAPQKPESQPSTSSQQLHQMDHIMKFKQLLPQLRDCLVNLISVACQNFAANATIDNLEKSVDTSTLPRFDRALEQFYSICNLIERHLMAANDQISHTVYSMQYTPMTAASLKDSTNLQSYGHYIAIVKQQLSHAKEIQNILVERSSNILTRRTAQQQISQTVQHRPTL